MGKTTIKNPMTWKLQGTRTSGVDSTMQITMPTEYNEVLLWGSYNTIQFSAVVPRHEISSTAIYPRGAEYYNSTNNESVAFKVTSTEADLAGWYYNGGTGRTTGVTFKLYYR